MLSYSELMHSYEDHNLTLVISGRSYLQDFIHYTRSFLRNHGGSKDRYTGEEITFESLASLGRPSCPNKVAHHCACFNE